MNANAISLSQSAELIRGGDSGRKREQKLTLIILLIAGLARLPFLWRGFGGHPDEWLVIRSGLDFWLHGIYYPSRPVPGFPLNEVLMGGLAWLGGAPTCAAAAMAASLGTLAYMRKLAPLHGVQDSFWMVIAFSFEPWVWSSGTHCLDYIWGTGSLVAAIYYIERRQFSAGGLACAIGFGFRPSSLLWIGPLFIRVVLIERRWQDAVRFALWAAIPALVPAAMITWVIATRPDLYANMGTEFNLIPSSVLAFYHFTELMGHVPAMILISTACFVHRDRLVALFRSGEGWVWNYVLIFACLFFQFWIESGKPEYMLPALPGLFMILSRCISDGWWKSITVAFVVNAFVSFGAGHASHFEPLRVSLAAPSLRPGPLLWYAERADASNDRVSQVGAELSHHSGIILVGPELDRLDDFYVSALLTRGPAAQARISCSLLPANLSFPEGEPPDITLSRGLGRPSAPPPYPALVCCASMSALVLSNTPPSPIDQLNDVIEHFCSTHRKYGYFQPTRKNLRMDALQGNGLLYAGADRGIRWNDAALRIEWPVTAETAIVSERDQTLPLLAEQAELFEYGPR
jgi:hypothetical protein